MSGTKSQFPPDNTEAERRKHLSECEIKDLELAGGIEGGMQAGNAGGPSGQEAETDRRPGVKDKRAPGKTRDSR